MILQVDDAPTLLEIQHQAEAIPQGNNSEKAAEAWGYLKSFAIELIRGRRKSDPDDSIVSALVHGTVDGRRLTEDEQVGVIMILLLGGLETTTGAFGNIVFHMTEDSSIEGRIRSSSWVTQDLDEFLRLDAPVQWLGRTVMETCQLGDVKLAPGDKVLAHLSSANRDESVYQDADQLNFDRSNTRHVAFGLGAHRCVGSHLARLELQIGFEQLLKRVVDIRKPSGSEVEFSNGMAHAPRQLPISFDRR